MVERICPQCQHGNDLDNRFCGSCGASLERNELATRPQQTGLVIAGQHLPAEQLKQVGQTVALSLATLAAEAGIAWLRRRVDRMSDTTPTQQPTQYVQQAQPTQTAIVPANQVTPVPTSNAVTIMSQRIVEVWEQGVLKRQTVERSVWRRDNQN